MLFDKEGRCFVYRYELHCHTKEISRCSRISAANLVRAYHELGYSGIVVTDHFFNGNTTVCRELDWKSKVDMFKKGYENALAEGEKLGMNVFFAWEYSYHGTDFLTYGLDDRWLYSNPDCHKWRLSDYFDRVHDGGGIIVQAHPYRSAAYIELIRLNPWKSDGVEVLNATLPEDENKMADIYAGNYGLFKTVGSDNHDGIREYLAAVETEENPKNIKELIDMVQNGKCTLNHYKVGKNRDGGYSLANIEHSWLKGKSF